VEKKGGTGGLKERICEGGGVKRLQWHQLINGRGWEYRLGHPLIGGPEGYKEGKKLPMIAQKNLEGMSFRDQENVQAFRKGPPPGKRRESGHGNKGELGR